MKNILKTLPFAPEYMLSEAGVLYRVEDGVLTKIIPTLNAEYPYWIISINGDWHTISCHILMAQTFMPNPYNYRIVNHKDGDKHNWSLSNLEWCTQSQNILHAQRNDLIPHTTKHDVVVQICEDILNGKTNKEISDVYGVSPSVVCHIRNGRRHAQVMHEVKSKLQYHGN